jgi:16S rRNA G966 N2-methylase RsmD
MGIIHQIMQHHFAELLNPNGICFEPDFMSVKGVFKVLVNVTLIDLVLCSLPDFDVLYLLDPPYKTTPSSFPSVFRKINIQKVGKLKDSVINFVITESNADWPNTD